jgi:tRNA(Arg) A34 adenosine deaminase TadA|tara:strand:- start:266 stop:856 length:591 start_codon:yes stop_codon:yes gene_type:complete
MTEKLLERSLDIFTKEILPLTEKGVSEGNKIFGAAILKKKDLSLVVAGSNNETENPIWHGETHTLKKFYEINKNSRPREKDCIFLCSHEPCSLCLSAITFSGFDNFYYLFPYKITNNEFSIPHDLKILKEVFKVNNGEYNRENLYWKSNSIKMLIEKLSTLKKKKFMSQLEEIKKSYINLSNKYQASKNENFIPLK